MAEHNSLKRLKLRSIKKRKSKVDVKLFSKPSKKKASFNNFCKSLPKVLVAEDLRELIDGIVRAKKANKMVIFMMGAHVIKCGLSPLIIDLMKRKVVKAIALNGAGIIHDTEIAMAGRTSEDVDIAIKDGSFGMTKESADFINNTISNGVNEGLGIGRALGLAISKSKFPYKNLSILYWGEKLSIPVTVHVGIGTDTIHQHPSCNGAAFGEGSLIDFKNFIYSVSRLNKGVIINFGSAVMLPEVFLKAISTARNLGYNVTNFIAANFDMHKLYRPQQNVIGRPTSSGGKGFNFIGHHEIMLPLLYQGVIEEL